MDLELFACALIQKINPSINQSLRNNKIQLIVKKILDYRKQLLTFQFLAVQSECITLATHF